MPSGYSEDRVFKYEDGGVIKSHREISWQDGMVVSKGTMVAENFPSDSPILTQDLKAPLPPQEVITNYKDGIRSMCNFVSITFPYQFSFPPIFIHLTFAHLIISRPFNFIGPLDFSSEDVSKQN